MVNTLHIIPYLFSNKGGLPFDYGDVIASEARHSSGLTNVAVINQEFVGKENVLFDRLSSSGAILNFLNQTSDKNLQLTNLHKKLNPDMVILWQPELITPIGQFLNQINTPVTLRASTTYSEAGLTSETKIAYKKCFDFISNKEDGIIICNSEYTKDWNHRNFAAPNHKQKVIVSGVELSNVVPPFIYTKESLGIDKDAYVVSNVTRITAVSGSINLRKDPFGFMLIASHLSIENPDAVFIMCGEGTNNKDLIQKIASLANNVTGGNLTQDNFKVLGHVENTADIYKMSDVHFSTAQSEAFGRTIVEAMKIGVPSIVTNTGIMPEMNGKIAHVISTRKFGYKDEGSYIGDGSTNLSWVKEVETQFNDLRSRSEARIQADSVYLMQRSLKEYDINNVAKKYLETYQEVIDNSRMGSVLQQANIGSVNKPNGIVHS